MIVLINKLLIVGDSVMGCFAQASGDGDASPDAVSYIGQGLVSIAVRVVRPGCEWGNLTGRFTDLVPTRWATCITLSDVRKKPHIWSRLRSLNRYSDFSLF